MCWGIKIMQYKKLLIEIGCEELPSRYIDTLSKQLFHGFIDNMQQVGLSVKNINIYSTPRRIALICNTTIELPSLMIEKQGPLLEKALDASGKPNAAGLGFAKSCNVEFDELEKIEIDGKRRLKYSKLVPKSSALDQIMPMLNKSCSQLRGFKMMRWSDLLVEFPRPVHWVVAMLDDDIIKGSFLGCETQRFTYGHRFLAADAVKIDSINNYKDLLYKTFVIADVGERKNLIEEQINNIVPTGCKLVSDESLLDEVVGLVEWPNAVLGEFNSRYLQLPDQLLIAVMKVHQKCFAITSKQKLVNNFITVANIKGADGLRIKRGNERVMAARLADAEFFFEADKKTKIVDMVEMLANVVFHSALGTLLDKTVRVQSLTKKIANWLHIDVEVISKIALLAKADLCSQTVGEFPDLHGVIGSKLAELEGYDSLVVKGISQHILPRFSKDVLPDSLEAQIIAIADRVDTLVGFFSARHSPSGDKDPYGLRRAAMAVVRIIVEKKLSINLQELIENSLQTYNGNCNSSGLLKQLIGFLTDRLKVLWLLRGGEVEVFESIDLGFDFLLGFEKMISLERFLAKSSSNELLKANKRLVNFLKHQKESSFGVDDSLFISNLERELLNKLEQIERSIAEIEQFELQLEKISTMATVLNAFFDGCLVLVEDESTKNNRLALLSRIDILFRKIAKLDKLSVNCTVV